VPPAPNMKLKNKFSEYELDTIAGVNLKVTLYHFVEVEGKYQATFNDSHYLSTVTANANLFFNRNWGLSYKFKYAQVTSSGTDIYNMLGLAYMF
jgi:hypothetical protein